MANGRQCTDGTAHEREIPHGCARNPRVPYTRDSIDVRKLIGIILASDKVIAVRRTTVDDTESAGDMHGHLA
jgi:hypothetical protein